MTDESPNMYTVPTGTIFSKNFVAGFARGLGGFAVTLISWVVIYVIITIFILPQIAGYFTQAQDLMNSLEKISQPTIRIPTL